MDRSKNWNFKYLSATFLASFGYTDTYPDCAVMSAAERLPPWNRVTIWCRGSTVGNGVIRCVHGMG